MIVNFTINICAKSFKNIKIVALINSRQLKDPNSDKTWKILENICQKFEKNDSSETEDLDKRMALFFTKNNKFNNDRIPELFVEYAKVEETDKIYNFFIKKPFAFYKNRQKSNLTTKFRKMIFLLKKEQKLSNVSSALRTNLLSSKATHSIWIQALFVLFLI